MFRKTKNNKTKSLATPIMYISVSIILAISALQWVKYYYNFDNKKFHFSDTSILDKRNYASLLDQISQEELMKIKLSELNKLIEKHPYVEAARISNRYPDIIVIEIMERQPLAILEIDPLTMIDSNGYVLPSKNNFKNIDLPILANTSDLTNTMNFGEKSTSNVINKAVSWLSYIKKYHSPLYKNISELKVSSSDELEIILSDYPTKIFLGQKKVKSRINSLLKFEEKLKTNKITDYNYLDLRYDKQIIAMERNL
tara:strand:- start:578 stop:1342 length:765 start_codon:yes stop_codon:yes gene_type:complete